MQYFIWRLCWLFLPIFGIQIRMHSNGPILRMQYYTPCLNRENPFTACRWKRSWWNDCYLKRYFERPLPGKFIMLALHCAAFAIRPFELTHPISTPSNNSHVLLNPSMIFPYIHIDSRFRVYKMLQVTGSTPGDNSTEEALTIFVATCQRTAGVSSASVLLIVSGANHIFRHVHPSLDPTISTCLSVMETNPCLL